MEVKGLCYLGLCYLDHMQLVLFLFSTLFWREKHRGVKIPTCECLSKCKDLCSRRLPFMEVSRYAIA